MNTTANMNETPVSNRTHIAVFGDTNAGKSALVNALTGSEISIVSPLSGTTTDPVTKTMELLDYGPVVFIDTAGLSDSTALGQQRMEKSIKMLDRADFVLYTADSTVFSQKNYDLFQKELEKRKIPHLLVLTKIDLLERKAAEALRERLPRAQFVSTEFPDSVAQLRQNLITRLQKTVRTGAGLLSGVLSPGRVAVLVAPIDSEAPAGRLILPQVQMIRACLDSGVRCTVTTVEYLKDTLADLKHVDLVITDSQAFHEVNAIVPQEMPLTSFSILMARQKGDLKTLVQGAAAVKTLQDGDRILIAEVCTHNRSHEDIARVKIPGMLKKVTGKKLEIEYAAGRDYPENLRDYALVIHCGGCMITGTEMSSRMGKADEKQVPITNFGVVLALGTGILSRSIAPFGITVEE